MFDILRVPHDGHYIYALNKPEDRALILILPHCRQLVTFEHFVEVKEKIVARLGYPIDKFFACRVRGDVCCLGVDILKACSISMQSPLLFIRRSDLRFYEILVGNTEKEGDGSQSAPSGSSGSAAVATQMSTESTPTVIASLEAEPLDEAESFIPLPEESSPLQDASVGQCPMEEDELVLRYSPSSNMPQVVSSPPRYASQETILMSEGKIEEELQFVKGQLVVRQGLDLPVPYVPEVRPSNSPNSILVDRGFFEEEVERICSLWLAYAVVQRSLVVDLKDLPGVMPLPPSFDRVCRFFIITARDEDEYAFAILDLEQREYGILCTANRKDREEEVMCLARRFLVENTFPELETWKGHLIIPPTFFHPELEYPHLLMSLFYIGKYFHYAVRLPHKVLYQERDFREYCHDVVLKLNIANYERNKLMGSLIGGDLRDDGFAMPSLTVHYDRAVVATDQCPFCKRRYFRNLGRHMVMAHGGQAKRANLTRRAQFGYL